MTWWSLTCPWHAQRRGSVRVRLESLTYGSLKITPQPKQTRLGEDELFVQLAKPNGMQEAADYGTYNRPVPRKLSRSRRYSSTCAATRSA